MHRSPTRRARSWCARLAALPSALAALAAPPALGQDIRSAVPLPLIDIVVAEVAPAEPADREALHALMRDWAAAFEEELGPATREVVAIMRGTADDAPDTKEGQWREAERRAAPQRAAALVLEHRFLDRARALLDEEAWLRLERRLRAFHRGMHGAATAELPPANVDPIRRLHDLVRGIAAPNDVDRSSRPALVPTLPPELAPHRAWIDEMDRRYLDLRRAILAVRREANEHRFRFMDLSLAGALDEETSDDLQRSVGRRVLPASQRMASFVRSFIDEARVRLPAPWSETVPEAILTAAYDELHADPTSPLDAVAAMASDPRLDEDLRLELETALADARAAHARLTAQVRGAEDHRRLTVMACEPGWRAVNRTQRVVIGDLLARRQTVNDALRIRVERRVDDAVRADHPLPPARNRRIDRWIEDGRRFEAAVDGR